VLDRERFLAEEDVIQSALLRKLARSFGFALSRSGTAVALQFMREGASGAGVAVEGKLDISRDFGALRLAPRSGGSPDPGRPTSTAPEELTIPSDAPGEGRLAIGGATLEVSWGRGPVEAFQGWEYVVLDRMALHYPLTLRGWRDGDRTRTTGGGKKLKKLFGELKLTRRERSRIAVLADAGGDVLWIPGHHRAPGSVPPVAGGPQDRFLIGVRDA
jgi:tRNA(Ile)-lysidine synthetase-like protein